MMRENALRGGRWSRESPELSGDWEGLDTEENAEGRMPEPAEKVARMSSRDLGRFLPVEAFIAASWDDSGSGAEYVGRCAPPHCSLCSPQSVF